MKNLFELKLHNADINNFKTLATSHTNNLQLVELYIRNVSTKVSAYIGTPYGSLNVHNVYSGNFTEWLVSVNDDNVSEELEMDTLGEVVDFIREYLEVTREQYNAWNEEVV
jgi:hypothetical protein